PNGDILSEKIVNWTLTNNHRRLELDLLIKGSDDMEIVSSAVKETVKESVYVIKEREPQVLFTKLQGDELGLKVFLWCADVAQSEAAMSDLLIKLKTGLPGKGLALAD
ncbi:MAG: mechanosensitive ion channel, partial [Chitinophagaceae bacterium]|nr:mechanosensitive ion channel [Chitinophagaceae bacterium]